MSRITTKLAEDGISAKDSAQQVEGGSLDIISNGGVRQPFTNSQSFGFISVGEETKVTDLHKAMRQDMHEETADELKSRNSHDLPMIVIPVVTPLEGDLITFELENAIVGDSDAVSIPTEIINDAVC